MRWLTFASVCKDLAGFVVWRIGKHGPWSNCTLYIDYCTLYIDITKKMAKTRKKRNGSRKNKETGKGKPRKSAQKNQTRRIREDYRMATFNRKKEEAQAYLDMEARETALKQLGIEDRFEFADHAKIYNADHGRFHNAPVKMVSVPTGYIAPPCSTVDYGSCASDGDDAPSPTAEQFAAMLRAEQRARAEDMQRAEQHFQRVRAEDLAKAGTENDGLRLRRAKTVLAAVLRQPK